jgi:hypothetical protein
MNYTTDIPTAKPLYAERYDDNKEFFVISGYVNRETGTGGITGVASDGKKAKLEDGAYKLYRR